MARAPSPRSSAPLAEREDVVEAAGGAGAEGAGRVARRGGARRAARARGGSAARCSTRDAVAAGERRVDDDVEDLGLVAQQLGGAHDVALGRRMRRRAARARGRPARARARNGRVAFVASSRQARPRARHHAAVSSRVTPSSGRTSRPTAASIPSSARRPGDAASR